MSKVKDTFQNFINVAKSHIDEKQDKNLSNSIPVNGTSQTTVEGTINALDNKLKKSSKPVSEELVWVDKTWNGMNDFNGFNIWTDGENIYYNNNKKLNKITGLWETISSNGIDVFDSLGVWSDGISIYYDSGIEHKKLIGFNNNTLYWENNNDISIITINGHPSPMEGYAIWTDGKDLYYSFKATNMQYKLNKTTTPYTWEWVTDINDVIENGVGVWTDGDNIYYSQGSNQYILDKTNNTWSDKTWNGIDSFYGTYIWTDGNNIYYSKSSTNKVLNKSTSTWNDKIWSGMTNFNGENIWTDGDNIYYSNRSGATQISKVLQKKKLLSVKTV